MRGPLGIACTAMVLLAAASAAAADPAGGGKRHTVTASVERAAGEGVGIQARLVPGPFAVPKGHVAGDFKFAFSDPQSGVTREKLGPRNIYSVTQRRYITEAANDPHFVLQPGEYKFVVGGGPGAMGTLSYTLSATTPGRTPGDLEDPPATGPRGARRVTIAMRATSTGEGWAEPVTTNSTIDALVTLEGERIVFEFDVTSVRLDGERVPPPAVDDYRFQATWKGTLTGQGDRRTLRAASLTEVTWSDADGGRGAHRTEGTVRGELVGGTLRGTFEEKGTTRTAQISSTMETKGEWSIDGFGALVGQGR